MAQGFWYYVSRIAWFIPGTITVFALLYFCLSVLLWIRRYLYGVITNAVVIDKQLLINDNNVKSKHQTIRYKFDLKASNNKLVQKFIINEIECDDDKMQLAVPPEIITLCAEFLEGSIILYSGYVETTIKTDYKLYDNVSIGDDIKVIYDPKFPGNHTMITYYDHYRVLNDKQRQRCRDLCMLIVKLFIFIGLLWIFIVGTMETIDEKGFVVTISIIIALSVICTCCNFAWVWNTYELVTHKDLSKMRGLECYHVDETEEFL